MYVNNIHVCIYRIINRRRQRGYACTCTLHVFTTRFHVDAHVCKQHSCMYIPHHQQEKTARDMRLRLDYLVAGIYIYIHVYIHIYIYVYMYIYTYIHLRLDYLVAGIYAYTQKNKMHANDETRKKKYASNTCCEYMRCTHCARTRKKQNKKPKKNDTDMRLRLDCLVSDICDTLCAYTQNRNKYHQTQIIRP